MDYVVLGDGMSLTVDNLLASQSVRNAMLGSTNTTPGSNGVFANYLDQAIQPSQTAATSATLQADPAMAMQSVMSLLLSSSLGDDSNDMLSLILMYLLMGRDDSSLPQLEQAYAPGDSEAEQAARVNAAATLPNFEANSGIVRSALTRLGDPYSQAKAGSDDYTDCSYLTRWCYRAAGVDLPRTAAAQAKYLQENGMTVSKVDLKPGDLIFYSFKNNDRYMNISHVGIYAGNGKMIDASSANGKVVYRDMFDGAVMYARPKLANQATQV